MTNAGYCCCMALFVRITSWSASSGMHAISLTEVQRISGGSAPGLAHIGGTQPLVVLEQLAYEFAAGMRFDLGG